MANENILEAKKQVVAELTEEFKSAQTLVLAEYLGLTVAEDTDLRTRPRDARVQHKLVKNTMGVRAAREAGYEELADLFKGPTAVAYSTDDVVAPAKILKNFSKEHEVFQIKGGASDGKVVSMDVLEALAAIPDLPVLYGKLVGSLISPISGLAISLKAIADKCEEAGAETAAEVVVEKEDEAEDEAAAEDAKEAAGDAEASDAPAAAEEKSEEAPAAEEKEEAPADAAE